MELPLHKHDLKPTKRRITASRASMELPLHNQDLRSIERRSGTKQKSSIVLALVVTGLLVYLFYPRITYVHIELKDTSRAQWYDAGLIGDLAIADVLNLVFVSTENMNFTETALNESFEAGALAYDPIFNRMFVSNTIDNSIYEVKLNKGEEGIRQLEQTKESTRIHGIAYDHITDTLFWTNGPGNSILYLTLGDQNGDRSLLLEVKGNPTGIALDICSRTLFWTTKAGTIEQSDTDGRNWKELRDGLENPYDITVDQRFGRLFWIDYGKESQFRIESSDLNGMAYKKHIVRDSHQPMSIATTVDDVYWINRNGRSMWSIPINSQEDFIPRKVQYLNLKKASGVISRENSISFDKCKGSGPERKKSEMECLNGGILNEEGECVCPDGSSGPECEPKVHLCLNGGSVVGAGADARCKCPVGFSGVRCELKCEQSQCFNYCNHNGTCSINELGEAKCQCMLGYSGLRCEIHLCQNFCLNGGECIVSDGANPSCVCAEGYTGPRCEHCSSCRAEQPTNSSTLYRCSDNSTSENCTIAGILQAALDSAYSYEIAVISMGIFAFVLIILVIFLLKNYCSLRKRPRIRKRIIVNKPVTPLTSRPPPADQCEITIEGCCNMNICDTPCYEPHVRTDSKGVKKEEKKNLLGSMEVGSSCAPSLDMY